MPRSRRRTLRRLPLASWPPSSQTRTQTQPAAASAAALEAALAAGIRQQLLHSTFPLSLRGFFTFTYR
jgi:hypothetical protein